MESHPIPQDVTSFQFKIVGDMTIKQFAYLAAGAVIGWLVIALPVISIIKVPIGLGFALFGAGLAFFPIEGRPLDIMVGNFLKALFIPTRYVYDKKEDTLLDIQQGIQQPQLTQENISWKYFSFFSNMFPKNLKISLKMPSGNKDGEKKEEPNPSLAPQEGNKRPHIITLNELGKKTQSQSQPPPKTAMFENTEEDKKKKEETQSLNINAKKGEELEKELETAKTEEKESFGSEDYKLAHQKVLELEKLFHETLAQKQTLERQILWLRNSLEAQKRHIYSPGTLNPKNETQTVTQKIRQIPIGAGKSVGLPITPEVPNLITGIIKDPRGNPLSSILVEVKDQSGNAVRAFKTSALGQFASATPLVNGTYTVLFEDPRGQNKFDVIEIKTRGEIILPLEVISQDTREELRQSLFNPEAN